MGTIIDHPGVAAFLIALCVSGFALGLCLLREVTRPIVQPREPWKRHK